MKMAKNPEDFVAKFINLREQTGERKKVLYNLLKTSDLSPNDQLQVIKLINPQNYCETVYYADIVIYFKQIEPLMDMLRSGNEIYISKVLKKFSHLQENFKSISAEQIVDEVLPKLSYSTKVKVLHKLLKVRTAKEIDDIHDCVLNRYGTNLARILLQGCTGEKIKTFLESQKLILNFRELKCIHEKNPVLIKTYFLELKKRDVQIKWENRFLHYLAENDLSLWRELVTKYKITNVKKLGRRTTKKFLQKTKTDVIKNPTMYLKYLNEERMVRIILKQGDFPLLYKNLFPNDPIELLSNGTLMDVLGHCPKKIRYDLFVTCFKEKFDEDIFLNENCIKDQLLDHIYDVNVRMEWAKMRYEHTKSCTYLKYYDISVGLPMLKELINVTFDKKKRSAMTLLLPQICAVNNNIKKLEEVMEYFCERHRNDDASVRSAFLNQAITKFKTENFTEKIWSCFDKLITIMLINKENDVYLFENTMIEYILYLYSLKKDKEAEETILKYSRKHQMYYQLRAVGNKIRSVDLKKILEFMLNNFDKIIDKDDTDYKEKKANLIGKILDYNSLFPDSKINLQRNDLELFKNSEFMRYYNSQLGKILCRMDLDEFQEELFPFFIENSAKFDMFQMHSFVKWNLKNNSNKFLKYIPNLIDNCLINSVQMYEITKYWPQFRCYLLQSGLDKAVNEHILKCMLGNLNSEKKLKCISMLSYILSSEEFIKVMEKQGIQPTISRVDIQDAEAVESFAVQKHFISSIKNTKEPLSYIDFLLEKCARGDFLQATLHPLHKAFYRISQDKLEPYIDVMLKKKNMIMQKQAIVLAANFCNKSLMLNTFKALNAIKNESLHKALFIHASKCFYKYPCKETYDIVMSKLELLTENDEEILKLLINVTVNSDYIALYFENVWNKLSNLKNSTSVTTMKSSFLSFVSNYIQKLSFDICKQIIQNNFLKPDDENKDDVKGINHFVVNFLTAYYDLGSFEFIFQLISNYKTEYWLNYKCSEKSEVTKFCNVFYNQALEDDFDLNLLRTFLDHWSRIFSLSDAFTISVKMKLFLFWKESSNVKDFALKIIPYLKEIHDKYGFAVFKISPIIFQLQTKIPIGKLLTYVLEEASEEFIFMWVIEVLKTKGDFLAGDKIRRRYLDVNDLLFEKVENDDIVKLHYECLFEN